MIILRGWYKLNRICLLARFVRRHTWILMGPDSNKMLKPGFKSLLYVCWPCRSCRLVYGIDRNRLKWKVIEEKDHSHLQQIKSNNFSVSLWVKKREKRIQLQLLLRHWVMTKCVWYRTQNTFIWFKAQMSQHCNNTNITWYRYKWSGPVGSHWKNDV